MVTVIHQKYSQVIILLLETSDFRLGTGFRLRDYHVWVCAVDIGSRVCCVAPPMSNPDYNMMPTNTNNVLIKSKLKLDSNAIAVRNIMSLRTMVAFIAVAWVSKVHVSLFTWAFSSNCATLSSVAWWQRLRSGGVFKSWICAAHCFSHENGEFDTVMIYQCLNMSFNGIAYFRHVQLLLKQEFPVLWWRDAPRVHGYQMRGRRCKQ